MPDTAIKALRGTAHMKKSLLSGVSLIAALAATGPAVAAGQWEGSYLGLSLGYGASEARIEDQNQDWFYSSHTYHQDGVVYGVQAGHNWQDNNTVWGIELDFSGTSIDRTQMFAFDNIVPNEVNWLATLRPRGGLAFGDTYIYQTVGLAVGDFDRSWTEFADVSDSWPDLGATKFGVAAGFGVERMIGGNWSVKTEVQALRFFQNSSINPDGYIYNIDDTVYTLKAGVNYAFGARRGGTAATQGQPFDFSGAFIGLDVGGHAATVQLSDLDYDDFGGTYDMLSQGLVGGLHAGHNWQANGFLYGVEAAFNLYGGDETTLVFGGTPSNFSSVNWGGDVKFKAGATSDNTLMYLTAGYAFRDYDLMRDSGDLWDLSGTHSGFIAGTGIEHALTPNLSARFEASYTGIGGDTKASPTSAEPYRGALQDVTLLAGVNYYLGERTMGTGALAPANWAGANVGVDGLFAYHHSTIFDIDRDDHGGNYVVPSFGAGAGVHAGYDWQNDAFVYGVLGDFALFTNDESDVAPGYRSIESSLNWMGTVRGRAGVATGQALFYATAGVAFADADLAYRYLPNPNPDSFIFDTARIGWTAGLGIERQISSSSSLKLETLYTSFGEESTFSVVPGGNTCSNGFGSGPCNMLGYDDTITMKVGYSFRFSGM